MDKPPAIIPHVKMTAGNKLLARQIWALLRVQLMNGKPLNADLFFKTYSKKSDEIRLICRHFAHLMGVNYPLFSDEFWKEHDVILTETKG